MPFLTFLRSRWVLRKARHHAETSRRSWLLSEAHHRRADEHLDAAERIMAAR